MWSNHVTQSCDLPDKSIERLQSYSRQLGVANLEVCNTISKKCGPVSFEEIFLTNTKEASDHWKQRLQIEKKNKV